MQAKEVLSLLKISSLLHCYSMKLYSRKKVQRIKEVLSDDEQNEDWKTYYKIIWYLFSFDTIFLSAIKKPV